MQVTRETSRVCSCTRASYSAKTGAVVATRVAGRIERLLVEPGVSVRQGDVLAELDRSALEVQVVQAQATLAAAEAALPR